MRRKRTHPDTVVVGWTEVWTNTPDGLTLEGSVPVSRPRLKTPHPTPELSRRRRPASHCQVAVYLFAFIGFLAVMNLITTHI